MAAIALITAGCKDEKGVAVGSIDLEKRSLTLAPGEKETLTVNVQPDNAFDKAVTWSTKNSNVATVDATGEVTAIAIGEAVIVVTAKDGGHTDECTVLVKDFDAGSNNPIPDDYQVRYIRTNGYVADVKYPILTVMSSRDDLERYYDSYNKKYDLSSGFKDAMTNYSGDFFANAFLVVVLLEEGSGSIRHKVKSIDEAGNIIITRLVPDVGTDDMAEWNIIIELNKKYKAEQFQVIFEHTPLSH